MNDFREVVAYCDLLDLSYQGPLFTWTNKREEGVICKKLDRVLVNDYWMRCFGQSYCVFESGGCSDHLRCRFYVKEEVTKPRTPFKFVNALTSHPSFLEEIDRYWSSTDPIYSSTSALFRLSKKLKGLKPILRILGKSMLSDVSLRAKESFEKLCLVQEENLRGPTEDTMRMEVIASGVWQLWSEVEEKYLKQKSKLHWLKVGDRNNKAFYNAIKVRMMRNAIREIKCRDGSLVTDHELIKMEAESFFRDFLTHEPSDMEVVSVELEISSIF